MKTLNCVPLLFLIGLLTFSCSESNEVESDQSSSSNDMIGFYQKENSEEIIDIYSGKFTVCDGSSLYYSDQDIIWENENIGRYSISKNDTVQWYQIDLLNGVTISTINADYSNVANPVKYVSISRFECASED